MKMLYSVCIMLTLNMGSIRILRIQVTSYAEGQLSTASELPKQLGNDFVTCTTAS